MEKNEKKNKKKWKTEEERKQTKKNTGMGGRGWKWAGAGGWGRRGRRSERKLSSALLRTQNYIKPRANHYMKASFCCCVLFCFCVSLLCRSEHSFAYFAYCKEFCLWNFCLQGTSTSLYTLLKCNCQCKYGQ